MIQSNIAMSDDGGARSRTCATLFSRAWHFLFSRDKETSEVIGKFKREKRCDEMIEFLLMYICSSAQFRGAETVIGHRGSVVDLRGHSARERVLTLGSDGLTSLCSLLRRTVLLPLEKSRLVMVGKLVVCGHKIHLYSALLHMMFQKVIPDIDMLGLRVLYWIGRDRNGTFGVTEDGDFFDIESIVSKLGPHPQNLGTATCSSNIFCFCRRGRDTVLFLGSPAY
ncbi:hypothetical protein L6452_19419 [Arctium lappa]|uniref:Uncharacterized protein n=1 Tax=Arctium lappa TaxID=4217 RepID=A0ACB9B922_ARCLA|nr:hypothetical protein L6452_19419 [Arctium lappa]